MLLRASLAMESSWPVRSGGRSRSLGGGGVEVDVDHAVDAELVGQRRQAADQPGLLEQLGPQAEDEVADVADRLVERVDRPLDPRPGHLRLVGHQVRHVFERQPTA